MYLWNHTNTDVVHLFSACVHVTFCTVHTHMLTSTTDTTNSPLIHSSTSSFASSYSSSATSLNTLCYPNVTPEWFTPFHELNAMQKNAWTSVKQLDLWRTFHILAGPSFFSRHASVFWAPNTRCVFFLLSRLLWELRIISCCLCCSLDWFVKGSRKDMASACFNNACIFGGHLGTRAVFKEVL